MNKPDTSYKVLPYVTPPYILYNLGSHRQLGRDVQDETCSAIFKEQSRSASQCTYPVNTGVDRARTRVSQDAQRNMTPPYVIGGALNEMIMSYLECHGSGGIRQLTAQKRQHCFPKFRGLSKIQRTAHSDGVTDNRM